MCITVSSVLSGLDTRSLEGGGGGGGGGGVNATTNGNLAWCRTRDPLVRDANYCLSPCMPVKNARMPAA